MDSPRPLFDSGSPSGSAPSSTPFNTFTTPNQTMATAVMAAPTFPPSLSPLTTANLQSHTSDSPPHSNASSPASVSNRRARSPKLSLDLSNMPPLSTPAPPSNTLLITRLEDPKIFHPASLATIRQHINSIAPLNSFSPLKSMARLIVSFYDEDSAVRVRQEIDGTAFSTTSVAKCYFGEPTPIGDEKKYLERPDAGRLFFISPPPSPPVGWQMRIEDPPNKEVHADDLASQLAKLAGRMDTGAESSNSSADDTSTKQYTADELSQLKSKALSSISSEQEATNATTTTTTIEPGASPTKIRSRSSTLIYDPKIHGDSSGLPAVMLETEDDSEVELDSDANRGLRAHTARPPVELMEQ